MLGLSTLKGLQASTNRGSACQDTESACQSSPLAVSSAALPFATLAATQISSCGAVSSAAFFRSLWPRGATPMPGLVLLLVAICSHSWLFN